MSAALLEVRGLAVDFAVRGARGRQVTHAVRDVSLTVAEGSVFGLVGESGSGKSTLARAALGLIRPTSGGSVLDGIDVGAARGGTLRALRRSAAMVFQNPVAALNPRRTAAASIAEPLQLHGLPRPEIERRVAGLLDQVGLGSGHGGRLPHELSGGQCQRVGIARALATRPRLLVLDEPTSALDVSVQAQILNLLLELKREHGLTYLLISHDLDVVRHMSDTVGVMYRGRLVEHGPAREVLGEPAHPYTRTLLDAIPGQGRERLLAAGPPEPAADAPAAVGAGCAFLPRCPVARTDPREACATAAPVLRPAAGRDVACHMAAEPSPITKRSSA
ncbi:oligopeptide/dipeptide ABC transporter ATP-binding protein [Streptomyces sp. GC420]|uniref:oligopeptide/dipeptide ABC transporter ATP-binding protein n=1 Tax=Streptomyces sp. GC420 TaxID=2697568 RepID=UPI001414EE4B|nr:oligopeptide/dipeptide ABC transporter ATP-binding protein [Streptomyces sp. GC420]NBM16623.1 ATP-binding cassette domain-containing protein [Streptomyces sp. GC420]